MGDHSCLIAYFSAGGTTARVAGEIAAGLRAQGVEVDLHRISRDARGTAAAAGAAGANGASCPGGRAAPGVDIGPDPRDYDLFGMGSPSYYYRAPFVVVDYLRALPPLDNRAAFAFVLHGTYRGRVGNEVRGLLTHAGARDAGFFHCQGIGHYLGYLRQGYRFSAGHPTETELAAAHAFGEHMAAAVSSSAHAPVPAAASVTHAPRDPRTPLVYALERAATRRSLVDWVYRRSFRVDPGRCTGCGLCQEVCPVANLTAGKAGRPMWGDYCLLCFSCEVACPEEAIRSAADWPLFQPVFRYNVWRARRDPALDAQQVRLRGGSVEAVIERGSDGAV